MSVNDTGLTRARRAAGCRGFTFVELMLSVGILSIVAVGTAAAMVQAPRITRDAREEMTVRAAMRGMVSEISSAPYSDVRAAFDGQGFPVAGLSACADDEDKLPGLIRVEELTEGTSGYFRVTLSVDWQGGTRARRIESVHYVANVRGDTAEELPAGASFEGRENESTDPNNAYYEQDSYQAEPAEDEQWEFQAAAMENEPSYEEEADSGAEPVSEEDPVETVPTSANGKGKGLGKNKNKKK